MISVMTVMTVASVRLKILTYLVWVSWKGTKSNSIVWQSSKTSTNKYISMLIYVLQFLLNKYNHALKKSTLTNLYWPTCNGLKLCVRWCSFTKINVEILFLEISVPILKKNMMLRFERQLNTWNATWTSICQMYMFVEKENKREAESYNQLYIMLILLF